NRMVGVNAVVHEGLDGVVAATTRLSSVDGLAGELIIGGFALEELAPNATFEEATFLLWHDRLPESLELADFRQALADQRRITPLIVDVLRDAANRSLPAMDALRMATGALDVAADSDQFDQATAILAR